AGLAWAAGLDPGHVALVGVAVLLAGGANRVLGAAGRDDWPEPPEETSGTGCHLVQLQARLLLECEDDGERFQRSLAARLRELVVARLHGAGYSTSGGAVADLLGPSLFDPLRPGSSPRHPLPYLGHLLDRLDELDQQGRKRGPPTQPSRGGSR
ncbi:MAG: hypothetical protein ACLGIA_13315, partial [Actinomycetes bacterium]